MYSMFSFRSWHSKRLRLALESLSAASDRQNSNSSPKLLANPDKVRSSSSWSPGPLFSIVNLLKQNENFLLLVWWKRFRVYVIGIVSCCIISIVDLTWNVITVVNNCTFAFLKTCSRYRYIFGRVTGFFDNRIYGRISDLPHPVSGRISDLVFPVLVSGRIPDIRCIPHAHESIYL